MRQNVLVTGATGFVGKNLVNKLLENKYNVIAVARTNFTKTQGVTSLKIDISRGKIPIRQNVNSIIHLASMTNIDECAMNPKLCIKTNVMGTLEVLELARKKKAKMIYISSSHVYGNPIYLPINEEHQINPVSMYGTSKAIGEDLCLRYADSYGIELAILRIFTVFGPYSQPYQIIGSIISQASKSNKIFLGNIDTKRDFVYVDDVVRAIIKATKTSFKKPSICNVGTGKSTKIKRMIQYLEKLLGKKIVVKSGSKRATDIQELRADISKIRIELGWSPYTSLDEGLKRTLESYNSKREK